MQEVNNINLDYETSCKVKIKSESLNQTGKCSLILTDLGQMKFSIYHPLGGAVMVSYMDEKRIQYLNRNEKVFYQVENNPENRSKMFLNVTDLSIDDLKEIMWGRKIRELKNDIEFIEQKQAVKWVSDQKIEIIYHKWHIVQGVNLPKLLTIKNTANGAYIKLAISRTNLGEVKNNKEMKLLENCEIDF